MPPAVVPRPGVGDFAVALLPELGFAAVAHQREFGAAQHRDIGPPDDLEQAECMSDFFVAPLLSAHYRYPEYFYLRRLQKHHQGLQIAPPRPRAILVDDDLAPRLGREQASGEQDPCSEEAPFCKRPAYLCATASHRFPTGRVIKPM